MGHTHALEHHDHRHDEVKHLKSCRVGDHDKCLCATKRFLLSALWGFFFGGVQLGVLWLGLQYFHSRNLGAEGDFGHTYADSTIILFGALLMYAKYKSLLRDESVENIGVIVNSTLFFFAAGMVVYYAFYTELKPISPFVTFVAGAIGFIGNYVQSSVLGHAHTHGPSTHSTTLQHIFFDRVNSLFVMLTAILAHIAYLPIHKYIKGFLTVVILILALVLLFKYGKLDWESWEGHQWISFEVLIVSLMGVIVYFVSSGKVHYIDRLTASLVALGMVVTGVINLGDHLGRKKNPQIFAP